MRFPRYTDERQEKHATQFFHATVYLFYIMGRRCEYVNRLGVFKNNEHVMVTTILDLTRAFFGGGGVGGGERGHGGGGEAAVKRALLVRERVVFVILSYFFGRVNEHIHMYIKYIYLYIYIEFAHTYTCFGRHTYDPFFPFLGTSP